MGRIDNKHRPLLVCFESAEDKNIVVSRSYLLCHHEKFQKVFVAPDRTQMEREKHKRLVTELKKRRSEGEPDLAIRNGSIIVRSGTSCVPKQKS